MNKSRSLLLLFILSLLNTQCADEEVSEKNQLHIKDYTMFVKNDDAIVKQEMSRLVSIFNARACIEAIKLVDDPEEANSTIEIIDIKGSRPDAKDTVGYGQWKIRSVYGEQLEESGVETYVTHHYSMKVEFDEAYFMSRAGSEKQSKQYELEKVTTHEFGHGMQLNHSDRYDSPMFPTINGKKDMSSHGSFFRYVRTFLGKDAEC